jgi:hypothetical protein
MINRKFASFDDFLQRATSQRALLFSLLIVGALLAFEIFNYSTTEFAMSDLLGNLSFWGMRWSTILALAFCGIDFAGIARLFTPEQGADEPAEVWYLLGAWLLAATMNAILTWWGVSIAILQHNSLGNAVIPRESLLKGVPIFVAIMVWLSRVLIIGTFSVAGEKLFWKPEQRTASRSNRVTYPKRRTQPRPSTSYQRTANRVQRTPQSARPAYSSFRPAPKPYTEEESYTQAPMVARSNRSSDQQGYS